MDKMKNAVNKFTVFILTLLILLFIPAVLFAQEVIIATPTTSKILLDGKEIVFQAYNIEGNNYFKLRDLAMTLRDTDKGFSINNHLQPLNGSVFMLPSKSDSIDSEKYQPVGSELQTGDGQIKTAVDNSLIHCDVQGDIKYFKIYNIDDYNYFKLREIAYTFDFSVTWDEKYDCIVIDTSNSYKIPPYTADISVNSMEEIGSVSEYSIPIFINEMPIFSYLVKTETPIISEYQGMANTRYSELHNVYVFAEDLTFYGFDVVCSDDSNNLYLIKNDSKKFGMMDGELVNTNITGNDIYSLYRNNKYVFLDDKQIPSYRAGDKTLIPLVELIRYCEKIDIRETMTEAASTYLVRLNLDFLMEILNEEFENSEFYDPYYEPSTGFYGNERYMSFATIVTVGSIYGKFVDETLTGICKITTHGDNNSYHRTYFMGYFSNDKANGIGIFKENFVGGTSYHTYARYRRFLRGEFIDNVLVDGITYKSESMSDVDPSQWQPIDGYRYEGARVNGYLRKCVVYNDGNNCSDRNFRFGYAVVCEGEIQDGQFCGYFRSYGEDGRLEFEGNYGDYIKTRDAPALDNMQ